MAPTSAQVRKAFAHRPDVLAQIDAPKPSPLPGRWTLGTFAPVVLANTSNRREHWGKRARRTKDQRRAVALVLAGELLPSLPVCIKLTRDYSGRAKPFDEHDGLKIAFKAVADEIAAAYGVPDNDPHLRWEYAQERGEGENGVRIEIQSLPPAESPALTREGEREGT